VRGASRADPNRALMPLIVERPVMIVAPPRLRASGDCAILRAASAAPAGPL